MEMKNSDPALLFEDKDEEDTFYAEIRRQILQLTSEDNEDLLDTTSFNTTNEVSNRSIYHFNIVPPPANHFCSGETHSSGSPPVWLINLWKNAKGTGVFIPQVACRKYQRPGRMNNSRRKIYRPVVNKD